MQSFSQEDDSRSTGADSEFSEIGIVAYRKHPVMLDLTVPRNFLCGDQASQFQISGLEL